MAPPISNNGSSSSICLYPIPPEPLQPTNQEMASDNDHGPMNPHNSTPLTIMHDALHATRHPITHHLPPLMRLPFMLPVHVIGGLAAAANQTESNHKIRDIGVGLTAEAAVTGGLASLLGAGPAGLAMLTGDVAAILRDNMPGPSWEEIGQMAMSRDLETRRQASEWIRARGKANVLALPADIVHAIERIANEILNSSEETHHSEALDIVPGQMCRLVSPTPFIEPQEPIPEPHRPKHTQQQRGQSPYNQEIVIDETNATPSITTAKMSPTLDIPLDNLRAIQPGISTTIVRDGVPIASLSGQINLQNPSQSRINASMSVGNSVVSAGLSTTLNRPLDNLRVNISFQGGVNFSINPRHPLKIQSFVPLVPGIGISSNIDFKHLRGLSQVRFIIGLPVSGLNVSFHVRDLIKPIENIFKKIFGGGGGDGSAGGLPFFHPDVYEHPFAWSGYVRNDWTVIKPVDVMNRYNSVDIKRQNLKGSLGTLAACSKRMNALALFNKAISYETEVWQSGDLENKIHLSERISYSFANSDIILQAYQMWQREIQSIFDQMSSLQKEAIQYAEPLADACRSFDFKHYPWPKEIYNKYLWLFLNAANDLQSTAQYVIPTIASDNSTIQRGQIACANLQNFQKWVHNASKEQIWNTLNHQRSSLYPQLQLVYSHHAYSTELLPFIMNVAALETEVQRSWNQPHEFHAELVQLIQTFFTRHQITLLNWCTFWKDWNKHCESAESLYAQTCRMTQQLSESADTSHHYHALYAHQVELASHIALARKGNRVAENNVKFNNLLNYYYTFFSIIH